MLTRSQAETLKAIVDEADGEASVGDAFEAAKEQLEQAGISRGQFELSLETRRRGVPRGGLSLEEPVSGVAVPNPSAPEVTTPTATEATPIIEIGRASCRERV